MVSGSMTESSSRRDFLRRAVAAGAGAAILPSFLDAQEVVARPLPQAGQRTPLGAFEPVRLGVIGTGGMGTEHCRALLRLVKAGRTDARIAALCDVCQPRLEAAKKIVEEGQGGEVTTFGDHRELLARPDLHAVLIATPEHWHQQMAEDAIEAGKDVYVEKPMTLRLPEALRLWDAATKNPDVRVNVGTQYVTIPSYVNARELIAQGTIGKPVWSQTSYCRNSKDGEWLYYAIDPAWQPGVNLDWQRWCGPAGDAPWDPEVYARWRRYRRWSTGIIGDLLVHRITPLIMAVGLGWPTRVTAAGGHYVDKAMENHDQVNLTIEFEDGHTMIVAGSTANEHGLETVIRGHRGNLFVGGRNATLRPERLFAEEVEERTIVGDDIGDPQDALRLRFLESVRTRDPVPSPVELAVKVMAIVDLATRSMWEGKAFGYDPAGRRVRSL